MGDMQGPCMINVCTKKLYTGADLLGRGLRAALALAHAAGAFCAVTAGAVCWPLLLLDQHYYY